MKIQKGIQEGGADTDTDRTTERPTLYLMDLTGPEAGWVKINLPHLKQGDSVDTRKMTAPCFLPCLMTALMMEEKEGQFGIGSLYPVLGCTVAIWDCTLYPVLCCTVSIWDFFTVPCTVFYCGNLGLYPVPFTVLNSGNLGLVPLLLPLWDVGRSVLYNLHYIKDSVVYCTLRCIVHFIVICTIPSNFYSRVQGIVHCNVRCTLRCTLRCAVHCTVHYNMHLNTIYTLLLMK